LFVHDINPVLLAIGPFEIRYYGLFYVIIFLYTYFYLIYLSKHKKIGLGRNDVESLMIWLTLGLIIGARLFEVLFYSPSYYLSDPLEVFAIWKGGLSFHGGLVGIIIAGYLFVRSRKISFFELADIMVLPLSIGLALGRLGNFINGELYGRITDVAWCFKFQAAEGCRHPSQLYEAAKNIVIFATLAAISSSSGLRKRLKPGTLLAIFLMMYAVLRFFIEFVREPEVMIGPLTIGQAFNIVMFIAGAGLIYFLYHRNTAKGKK
jgi:phosphatidylglycerol:prolipoprotein diacylglycerol transferase